MSQGREMPVEGTTGSEGNNISQIHSNHAAEVCQGAVVAALRALHAFSYQTRASKHEVCHLLGLSSPRVLQEIIARERQTAPICSSASGGYWLAAVDTKEGRAEISGTAATMERRAVETFRAAAALRRWTRVPLGQMSFGDGGADD